MLDASQSIKDMSFGAKGGSLDFSQSQTRIKILNDTDEDLPRFAVLGIDGPAIDPDDNENEFTDRIVLSGSVPDAETHEGAFVICLEPVLAHSVCEAAVISGVTIGRLYVSDDCYDWKWAEVVDEEVDFLKASTCGSAQILWRAGGTGEQWAVFRIGISQQCIENIRIVGTEEEDFSEEDESGSGEAEDDDECCDTSSQENIWDARLVYYRPGCDDFVILEQIWAKRIGNADPDEDQRFHGKREGWLEGRKLYSFEFHCCEPQDGGSDTDGNPPDDPPDDDVVITTCCADPVPPTLYAQLLPNNVTDGHDPFDAPFALNRDSLGKVVELTWNSTVDGWEGSLLIANYSEPYPQGGPFDYILRLTCVDDNWNLAAFSGGGAGNIIGSAEPLPTYYGQAGDCSPFSMAFSFADESNPGTGARGVWLVTSEDRGQDCDCIAGTFTLTGVTACCNMNRTWTLTKQDDGCYWLSELIAMADSGDCAPWDHFGKIFWKMHSVFLPNGQRYWNLSCIVWSSDTYAYGSSGYAFTQYNATTAPNVNGSVVFTQKTTSGATAFAQCESALPSSITVDLLQCTTTPPGPPCSAQLCLTFDDVADSSCSDCDSVWNGLTLVADYAFTDPANGDCVYFFTGPQNFCGDSTMDWGGYVRIPSDGTGLIQVFMSHPETDPAGSGVAFTASIAGISFPVTVNYNFATFPDQFRCDWTAANVTIDECVSCSSGPYSVALGTATSAMSATTKTGITTQDDDMLIVTVVYKCSSSPNVASNTCTYNGSAMTRQMGAGSGGGVDGYLVVEIWTKVIAAGVTGSVVHTAAVDVIVQKNIAVTRVACLANNVVESGAAVSFGTSTTQTAGLTPVNAAADWYIHSVIGTRNAATGDSDGMWDSPLTDGGQDVVVNGALRHCEGGRICDGTEAATVTCQKIEATSRLFAGCSISLS